MNGNLPPGCTDADIERDQSTGGWAYCIHCGAQCKVEDMVAQEPLAIYEEDQHWACPPCDLAHKDEAEYGS